MRTHLLLSHQRMSSEAKTDQEMDARQMMRDKYCLIRFLLFFFFSVGSLVNDIEVDQTLFDGDNIVQWK